MGSYIMSFTVYTMAMCGLICFALFVYKKFASGCMTSKKSGFLSIESSLSIAPRKTLYVVKAGEERFLIASDVDKTSLISKLNADEKPNFEAHLQQNQTQTQNISKPERVYREAPKTTHTQKQIQRQENTTLIGVDELPRIVTSGKKNSGKSSDVLKSMVSRIKD